MYFYVLYFKRIFLKTWWFSIAMHSEKFPMFWLLNSKAYSEPSHKSKMGLFSNVVNGWKPLTIFAKSSLVDAWLGSEYTSETYHKLACKLVRSVTEARLGPSPTSMIESVFAKIVSGFCRKNVIRKNALS